MMRLSSLRMKMTWLPVVILVGLFAVSIAGLLTSSSASAQVQRIECRAVIVLDRSGSVAGQMATMKAQVKLLFDVGGIYDDHIKLAFWSFANDFMSSKPNYNSPNHDYVSSFGHNTSFDASIDSLRASGGTNYEHAFAHRNGEQNPYVAETANSADVIVFVTDGAPNPDSSKHPAREIVLRHKARGTDVIGGIVGTNTAKRPLNYVINGSETNATDTFFIRSNYSDLSDKLKEWIEAKCYPKIMCQWNSDIYADDPRCKEPEPVALPYALKPIVEAHNTVISGSDSASFGYKIENLERNDSKPTTWSVKRVLVDRGQAVDRLQFGGSGYQDEYSCAKLLALVSGNGTCEDAGASGNRVFKSGVSTLSAAELGPVSTTAVDDDWEVGTKLCYVLTVEKPTEKDSPSNRYSSAACVIVGKRPTFQVHGGDVVVGRHFAGDDMNSAAANIRGSLTAKTGSINKTFGSWVEYGVFAPGVVGGVASASGLEGGANGNVTSNQEFWSTLTFANTDGEYGKYTRENGMGAVANTAEYFIRGRTPVATLEDRPSIAFNGGGVTSGLYTKTNGSITLEQSSLEKGKMVILYVPNGTVTIAGNVTYQPGGYGSIAELSQMIIIARNITINGNVSRVDSWLLAQDDEQRGGTVATCDATPPLSSEVCGTPLVVNGPVVAKDVLLRRTAGAGAGEASGDPAEIFNLRADAYLWGYNEGRSALRAETTHTIELPPHF